MVAQLPACKWADITLELQHQQHTLQGFQALDAQSKLDTRHHNSSQSHGQAMALLSHPELQVFTAAT